MLYWQVVESEVIQSIDRAIDAIHHQVTLSGHQYTHEQKSNLRYETCI